MKRRRIPVLLQMHPTECGPACLSMILSFYGRSTSIAECRSWFGTGRDGMSARMIAQLAREHGLRVKAFSITLDQLSQIPLPAIAHWSFNHLVVIERRHKHWVEIVDPAIGRRRLSRDEVGKHFTGVVLTFEPGAHFMPQGPTAVPWRAYLRQMFSLPGLKGVLTQVLLVSLIIQLLGLALPIFTKILVDYVLPFQNTDLFPILAIGMSLVILVQLVTGYLRSVLLLYLQGRFDLHLMLGLFEHLLKLPFRFFEQRTTGDILLRLSSSSVIREFITSQTLSVILDGALILGYLLILFTQAPLFGLIAAAVALVQVVLLVATAPMMHRLMREHILAQTESQSYLVQALEGIATLKASGVEMVVLDFWSNLFCRELNVALRRNHVGAMMTTTLAALRTLLPFLLLWIGVAQVLRGTMSLGTMLALNAIGAAFLQPLASLVATGQHIQLAGAHLQRLAHLLDEAPEQHQRPVTQAPDLSGAIEVRNLQFRYSPQSSMVLRDISLNIAPGQKVALVGRTGSGKSTLAAILLGLYEPTEGQIAYDGVALSELSYHSVRQQMGVVLQTPLLFSGSIRQNIALNSPGMSMEEIVAAAETACIHEDIQQMPMGYETLLGESGGGLSGGQCQRLSLARALAHRPRIMLLDEATSHLDVATEARVDERLSQLACTRIVIAHRLSTVRNADLIIVLRNGQVVEQGTHAALMALNGEYAALVSRQIVQDAAAADDAALPMGSAA